MTCKEKLEREFPDANIDKIIDQHCPHNFMNGWASKPKPETCNGQRCRACWCREYNPQEVKKG